MTKLIPPRNLRLDPKLAAFPYQSDAVEAVQDLEYSAIFHEQGLGKTKIALDIALHWIRTDSVDAVLIITKKTLIENWRRECATHSFLRPVVLTQSRRNNFFVFNSPSRLLLANYEVINGEFDRFNLFLKSREVGVILDESAKIKSPQAEITKALHKLSPLFRRRVIMTGTPVANRPYDIWSQIWFLDRGAALGSDFAEYRRRVDLPAKNCPEMQAAFEASIEAIWRSISAFSVRETKDSGVISLPDKVIENISADWEDLQYDLYMKYRDDLKAIVVKEGIPAEDHAEGVLKRLLRLVQIASNPRLVDEGYRNQPGKLDTVKHIVSRIIKNNEKCIVWSCFNENVDWLAKEMKPWGTCRIHGRLSIEERNRSVDKFLHDADVRVLVATTGAAKEGLTLTSANHAIFYDRGFGLDDYLQAQDRIHRISQKKTCYVYNIMLPKSIDEWVDVLLHAKHMSAKLAQGDIQAEEFRKGMRYDFAEILQGILNMGDQQPSGGLS
jgi:SNF2 family DNA or RNA helicase